MATPPPVLQTGRQSVPLTSRLGCAGFAVFGLGGILFGTFLKGCQSEHSRAHHVSMAGYDVSPDGKWVAFAANGAGGRDLYLLNLDSGAVRALTSSQDYESGPAFSPDGKRLAFARGVPGVRADQLCVMLLGTGAIEQVTDADENVVSPAFVDDDRLVFVVEREYRWGGMASSWGGDGVLRLLNLRTGAQTPVDTSGGPAYSPRVSQDGEWFAWSGSGVYRSRLREPGKGRRLVSTSSGLDLSSDGALLAVSQGEYSPDHKIYLIEDGQRRLISGEMKGCFEPRFSADMEYVYFTSEIWQGGSHPDTSLMRTRLSDGKVELVAPATLFWEPTASLSSDPR